MRFNSVNSNLTSSAVRTNGRLNSGLSAHPVEKKSSKLFMLVTDACTSVNSYIIVQKIARKLYDYIHSCGGGHIRLTELHYETTNSEPSLIEVPGISTDIEVGLSNKDAVNSLLMKKKGASFTKIPFHQFLNFLEKNINPDSSITSNLGISILKFSPSKLGISFSLDSKSPRPLL